MKTVMNQALRKYSLGKPKLTTDMTQTSFALLHGGQGRKEDVAEGKYTTSWELIENDGEGEQKGWRQRNFVEFMRYIKEIFQLESVIIESYDWKAAGKAKVVDVSFSLSFLVFFFFPFSKLAPYLPLKTIQDVLF
jgi:hypothetical protein